MKQLFITFYDLVRASALRLEKGWVNSTKNISEIIIDKQTNKLCDGHELEMKVDKALCF